MAKFVVSRRAFCKLRRDCGVFLFGQSFKWGWGYAYHNATHPLAIHTRPERESFEQNTSIKLKNFALLCEATSMSREELSPELSVDSEDVENVGIRLLSLHNRLKTTCVRDR